MGDCEGHPAESGAYRDLIIADPLALCPPMQRSLTPCAPPPFLHSPSALRPPRTHCNTVEQSAAWRVSSGRESSRGGQGNSEANGYTITQLSIRNSRCYKERLPPGGHPPPR